MATLLLTAVGSAFGPLGGAIGALIGQQIDGAIFGKRKVEGPRLKELSVQTSSYGSALPMHFGTIRASGSVIWATELVEHKQKDGGGKGRPSVTSYTYTASFAVAVASRPIAGIGRIWADGNLLRGAAGDLKVGGTMRLHEGYGDQAADPLLAQAEGPALNPAYRNLAYVVFEDLELGDFGNRLPSLTFEIIADPASVTAGDIIRHILPSAEVSGISSLGLSGYTIEQGGSAEVIATLSEIAPIACTVSDEQLVFRLAEEAAADPATLPAPCAGGESAEDARASGWSRRREALPVSQQCAVRYYDVGRDYQPGLQRSIGRSAPGDVATIELPTAMTASEASAVADRAARRRTVARDTLRYRITEIDRRFYSGAVVKTPVTEGLWRVEQWEWQADGVMLDLASVLPTAPLDTGASDHGRANQPPDLQAEPTQIVAFELPWDGRGDPGTVALRVAASAQGAGWTGASLFAQSDDGQLRAIGVTGRGRATLGRSLSALPAASPLMIDLQSSIDVALVPQDFTLTGATWLQMMQGSNLAILGEELFQFARAEPISTGVWRLSGLLRGRGGTEWATSGHVADEPFALIDDALIAIDPATVAGANGISALGLGDTAPASSPIINSGLGLQPLSPVHGRAQRLTDGGWRLDWVRRARGGWEWRDEMDLLLNEPQELWQITYGTGSIPVIVWNTTQPNLELSPDRVALLGTVTSAHCFNVRQVGRSLSLPLKISPPQ
ncbi:MAG: phage tail baseplate protein [Novosphingobium sp.]